MSIDNDLTSLEETCTVGDGYGVAEMTVRVLEIKAQVNLLEDGEEKTAFIERLNEAYRAWFSRNP